MASNSYRKIPEIVTAVQYDGANIEQIKTMTGGTVKTINPPVIGSVTLAVLGKDLTLKVGDWLYSPINSSSSDRFGVMTDATFRKTYEPSEDLV